VKDCGLFRPHDWTAWAMRRADGHIQRHPFAKEMVPVTIEWQERRCQKCGLYERKELKP